MENKSRREIRDIKVKLFQKVKLRTANNSKKCSRLVSTLNHQKIISSKTNQNWNGRLGSISFIFKYGFLFSNIFYEINN
jgi:hypothetical protein